MRGSARTSICWGIEEVVAQDKENLRMVGQNDWTLAFIPFFRRGVWHEYDSQSTWVPSRTQIAWTTVCFCFDRLRQRNNTLLRCCERHLQVVRAARYGVRDIGVALIRR